MSSSHSYLDGSEGAVVHSPLPAIFAIGSAATLLLFGYEFVRSVSSSLFIGFYGADRLPIVMTISPLATLAMVYGYGWLISVVGPRRALSICSLGCAAVITACYVGLASDIALASAVLYVFREAYIVLLVEQYWSFINSTVDKQHARAFNGPITGFGSIGAIAGATMVKLSAGALGSETLLLFAAVSLLPAAFLSDLAYSCGGEPRPSSTELHGKQGQLGLGEFFRQRRLVLLLVLVMLTQALNTALDLRFSGLVEHAFPSKDLRTAYLGGFYATLNAAAFVLQFGLVPLLLRWVPLRIIHTAIPLVHASMAALLIAFPVLGVGALAFGAFKTLDYSLFRAAKEILYIGLPFDSRYRAKAVIDAFGYRLAKGGMSALLGGLNVAFAGASGILYPAVALVCAVVWVPVARKASRM